MRGPLEAEAHRDLGGECSDRPGRDRVDRRLLQVAAVPVPVHLLEELHGAASRAEDDAELAALLERRASRRRSPRRRAPRRRPRGRAGRRARRGAARFGGMTEDGSKPFTSAAIVTESPSGSKSAIRETPERRGLEARRERVAAVADRGDAAEAGDRDAARREEPHSNGPSVVSSVPTCTGDTVPRGERRAGAAGREGRSRGRGRRRRGSPSPGSASRRAALLPERGKPGAKARRDPLFLAGAVSRASSGGGRAGVRPDAFRHAGRTKRSNATAAETGFPGRPKTSVSPFVPKKTGLAGRIATLWKRARRPAPRGARGRGRSRRPRRRPSSGRSRIRPRARGRGRRAGCSGRRGRRRDP